ncbi:hypothetical protein FIBSPDRAFT_833806 [Athelia psychrophila]|uniref:Uncharacterized protein n=1 Tax=Athelia psychrophila TaxID=1759441 RepID=A0A166DEY8_9AGAM|nr:hypothetical protein FIBSPDRAFT_833806 [Fibularhizoctonia sp. CBS 109695]
MGSPGSGKTTFIAHASEKGWHNVNHSMVSSTEPITPIQCKHPNIMRAHGRSPIILVDTPGFLDGYSETKCFEDIAGWMKANIELAGIILLHKISDNRMTGTDIEKTRKFASLCGHEVMKNIVVATTMWGDGVSEEIGQMRQTELKKDWLIGEGCAVEMFEKDAESAWRIINQVLDLPPCPRLRVQGTKIGDLDLGKATGGGWRKVRALFRKGRL